VSARTARILAIMGSGETAPTMVTPHREIVARLGEPKPRAVLLDTPYGFQENAAEITQRAIEYFGHRVQLTVEPAGFLGPLAADQGQRTPMAEAAALSRLRTADFVFAGPGSPSYALSVWRGSPVPEAIAAKLAEGGAVVFSSAAALTLGRFSVPVYEIYKVGAPVHWLDGLDLVGAAGFEGSCVVIPHYDNAEGGTHDTRFCYLGERRLAAMEAMLPDDGWVLGIDEHTVLVVDLESRTATVSGRGSLTIRRRGASRVVPAGERLELSVLLAGARGEASSPAARGRTSADEPAADEPAAAPQPADAAAPRRSPLLAETARLEHEFEAAIAGRKAPDAAEAILTLDRTIAEWSADTLQTDDPDRARAILYSMVQRLGEAATGGLRDPRELLAPLVESLITLRGELRAAKAFELADRVRDRLIAARIELRDTPAGTTWDLRG
jgi:cyanophycinase-like exopeptidase